MSQTKRKTMGEQVAEQAVKLESLQNDLASHKARIEVLQADKVRLEQDNGSLLEALNSATNRAEAAENTCDDLLEAKQKVEKELETQKSSYKYASDRYERAEAEIEQAHAVLDTIPEATPKEFEKDYGKGKHPLAARFMGTMMAVVRASK